MERKNRELFLCEHCKKEFEDHQAKTYNCPLANSTKAAFNKMHVFSPNYDLPIKETV